MSAPGKDELRREALRKRAALPDREERDRAIFEAVSALPQYRNAQRLLFYVSVGSEPDTRRLLRAALEEGREVYAPFCPPGDGDMRFCRVRALSELRPGRFGIPEPDPALEREGGWEGALVLTPGAVFDRRGYRLGYGKGYYDRFLAGKELESVGLCYRELVLPRLPAEEHDRRVRLLATEDGIFVCR